MKILLGDATAGARAGDDRPLAAADQDDLDRRRAAGGLPDVRRAAIRVPRRPRRRRRRRRSAAATPFRSGRHRTARRSTSTPPPTRLRIAGAVERTPFFVRCDSARERACRSRSSPTAARWCTARPIRRWHARFTPDSSGIRAIVERQPTFASSIDRGFTSECHPARNFTCAAATPPSSADRFST